LVPRGEMVRRNERLNRTLGPPHTCIPPQIAKKLDLMISDLQRGRPVDLRKLPPAPEEGALADVNVGRVQPSTATLKLNRFKGVAVYSRAKAKSMPRPSPLHQSKPLHLHTRRNTGDLLIASRSKCGIVTTCRSGSSSR